MCRWRSRACWLRSLVVLSLVQPFQRVIASIRQAHTHTHSLSLARSPALWNNRHGHEESGTGAAGTRRHPRGPARQVRGAATWGDLRREAAAASDGPQDGGLPGGGGTLAAGPPVAAGRHLGAAVAAESGVRVLAVPAVRAGLSGAAGGRRLHAVRAPRAEQAALRHQRVPLDARVTAADHRGIHRRVHSVERVDVQFRDHPAGA
eukprot:ctg_328.g248